MVSLAKPYYPDLGKSGVRTSAWVMKGGGFNEGVDA